MQGTMLIPRHVQLATLSHIMHLSIPHIPFLLVSPRGDGEMRQTKGLTTEEAFDIAKQVLERRVMNGKTVGENRISSDGEDSS